MSLRSTFTAASIRGWSSTGTAGGSVLYNPLTTDIQYARRLKLSHDGNYLIVGSTNGAWIYKRTTVTTDLNAWALQQQLPTPAGSSTFGFTVDINGDGSIAAVGDPTWNGNRGRLSTFSRTGVVWSSIASFTGNGDVNSYFSREISMDSAGTKIASNYDVKVVDAQPLTYRVFLCNTTGVVNKDIIVTWSATSGKTRVLAMTSPGTGMVTNYNDQFWDRSEWSDFNPGGYIETNNGPGECLQTQNTTSMAINSDMTQVVFGSPGLPASTDAGKVFYGVGDSIPSPPYPFERHITFPTAGDKAGISIDINNAGDTMVVGTMRNTNTWVDTNGDTQIGANLTTSAVYVYRRVGTGLSTVWSQSAILESGTGLVQGFGLSVSIDKVNGNYIAVGSPTANPFSNQNVRLYRYNGTNWSNSKV